MIEIYTNNLHFIVASLYSLFAAIVFVCIPVALLGAITGRAFVGGKLFTAPFTFFQNLSQTFHIISPIISPKVSHCVSSWLNVSHFSNTSLCTELPKIARGTTAVRKSTQKRLRTVETERKDKKKSTHTECFIDEM